MSMYTRIADLQNLNRAWDKMRANRPACGVDNITWEMFDSNRREELKQLNTELANGGYRVMPVKNITLYRDDKERTIALYCMRDKALQQSVAFELGKIYEPLFADSVYAYRPDRSALAAAERIENAINSRKYKVALKADIHHFFDEIDQALLKAKLGEIIREEDVLELIISICAASILDRDGEIKEKRIGIHQGASTAPILSNIYLMEMDAAMSEKNFFYLRYSDDILVLAEDEQTAREILGNIRIGLEKLGLSLNEKKTMLAALERGVDFLGYHFDRTGKTIPAKAEENLTGKLEGMWLVMSGRPLEERLHKGAEILDGWEQYFRGQRSPASIYEFAVVMFMSRRKDIDRNILTEARKKLQNTDKAICTYLAGLWKEYQLEDMVLREYEDYYELTELDAQITIGEPERAELIKNYEALFSEEKEEFYTELMQLYTDCGCFNRAGEAMNLIKELQRKQRKHSAIMLRESEGESFTPLQLTAKSMELYFAYFVGREDTYACETIENGGRRSYEQAAEPLTAEVLRQHLRGETTLGTYVQRTNATCKFMVFDIDIAKQILLSSDPKKLGQYMQRAAELTQRLVHELARLGLNGYIEESGYRGYHVWVLFDSWIQTRYINMLQDIVEEKMGAADDSLSIEMFPNKTRLKAGKPGQVIKLPYGVHMKTGKQSRFLDERFEPIRDLNGFLADIVTYSANSIKRIISVNTSDSNLKEDVCGKTEVDRDLSAFDMTANIRVVLENCNLMRYLCQKARTTGYLSHFERLSLLYVFAHMGDEGAEFLHQIMRFTLNYKYHVTQRFIQKVAAKPISCLKLRDQYRKQTAEFGCSCVFKHTKNCYPSPVLHAIKSGSADDSKITLPVGRTLSKEKEAKVCEELNITKKTQALTARILELKKQRRGLDKSVAKLEHELEQIFDDAGIDCLELEMGLLVRRKKADGYEWVVEI